MSETSNNGGNPIHGADSAHGAGSAWERVQLARDLQRPTSQFYIGALFQDFLEFHGDRYYGDDGAIIGGLAWFDGMPVTVIGQEKGRDTNERLKRNFGSPHPEGYRKALRLMEQADKFKRPIINLIDTQGAYSGLGAEERGQGRAIAENLQKMMGLTVPVISVVIGEAGSGGALALAVADRVAMFENAIYSIISPEGFASILWKDGSRAQEAADVMKLTAQDLKELNIIDAVIPEPVGAAQADPKSMAETLDSYLKEALKELLALPEEERMQRRYDKFRAMGRME